MSWQDLNKYEQQQQQLVHELGLKRAFGSRGEQEKEKIKSTHPTLEITTSPPPLASLWDLLLLYVGEGKLKHGPRNSVF